MAELIENQARKDVTAFDVAAFLRRNPDFLSGYPELALSLTVPRNEGPATSLSSYQLEVLRDKNRALAKRLQELVQIAIDNEQLMVRVHAFTLTLMRAGSAADTLHRLTATLTEDFHTDLVRLILFAPIANLDAQEWLRALPRGSVQLKPFGEFIEKAEPLCGRLHPDKLALLFGEQAEKVKSTVLIPIPNHGMMAVGSKDENRFHPGMGTLFLKLIADAVAAAMDRFHSGNAS